MKGLGNGQREWGNGDNYNSVSNKNKLKKNPTQVLGKGMQGIWSPNLHKNLNPKDFWLRVFDVYLCNFSIG